MRFLIGPLKGEEELWVVFWIYAVLLSVLSMLGQAYFAFNPVTLTPFWDFSVHWIALTFGYVYTLWVNVALWQCAFNTVSKSTPYLIRFGVICTFAFTLVSLAFDIFGSGSILPTPDASDPDTESLRKILEILQKQQ